MLVVILLIKNSKRDFLENSKDEVTGPEGTESSSVCSTKALEKGSSGAVTDGTVRWRLMAQIEQWVLV